MTTTSDQYKQLQSKFKQLDKLTKGYINLGTDENEAKNKAITYLFRTVEAYEQAQLDLNSCRWNADKMKREFHVFN